MSSFFNWFSCLRFFSFFSDGLTAVSSVNIFVRPINDLPVVTFGNLTVRDYQKVSAKQTPIIPLTVLISVFRFCFFKKYIFHYFCHFKWIRFFSSLLCKDIITYDLIFPFSLSSQHFQAWIRRYFAQNSENSPLALYGKHVLFCWDVRAWCRCCGLFVRDGQNNIPGKKYTITIFVIAFLCIDFVFFERRDSLLNVCTQNSARYYGSRIKWFLFSMGPILNRNHFILLP